MILVTASPVEVSHEVEGGPDVFGSARGVLLQHVEGCQQVHDEDGTPAHHEDHHNHHQHLYHLRCAVTRVQLLLLLENDFQFTNKYFM